MFYHIKILLWNSDTRFMKIIGQCKYMHWIFRSPVTIQSAVKLIPYLLEKDMAMCGMQIQS